MIDNLKRILSRSEIPKRGTLRKIFFFLVALIKEIPYLIFLVFTIAYYLFKKRKTFDAKDKRKCLVYFIPGLFAPPQFWSLWIRSFMKKNKDTYFYSAKVPRLGNCPLVEAGKPLLKELQEFASNNPDTPITLIGHSNGGRVASWIYTQLNTRASVKLIALASPLLGTRLANFFKGVKWAGKIVHPVFTEEVCFESKTALKLMEELRKKGQKTKDRMVFLSSFDDRLVFPETAALPLIEAEEEHYLVEGEGHLSLLRLGKKLVEKELE